MSNNGIVSDVKAALSTVAEGSDKKIYTLSTGVRVKLHPVSSMLLQKAMGKIKDPAVPIVKDEAQGREWENPSDPIYQNELLEKSYERGYARLNTIILWGVELVDGLPDDDSWLKKLRLMEKQDLIDLSDLDLNEPIEREFAYKKFIAIGNDVNKSGANKDLNLISNMGVVSEEAIGEASEVFPSETERATNSNSAVKESEVISE